MIFIPLPFAVTLLLLFSLVLLLREGGMAKMMRPMLLLIAGYALITFLLGLRWGYGLRELQPLIAITASALAPWAWLSFRGYAVAIGRGDLIHALPTIAVALLVFVARRYIDAALAMIFIFYGLALLRLGLGAPDALVRVPLEHADLIRRSLVATAVILVGSALADVFIAADFAWSSGTHIEEAVAIGNLVGLLVLGIAAATAGRPDADSASGDAPPESESGPSEEDRQVLRKVELLVEEKELYRDPDLTLNRLARRALLPARRISEAVNRGAGVSVSQFVNRYRIAEAKHLLATTTPPVTAIMFDSGFQTKSNFNRAFLAETGESPAQWRGARAPANTGS